MRQLAAAWEAAAAVVTEWAEQTAAVTSEAFHKLANDPAIRAVMESWRTGPVWGRRECECVCARSHPDDMGICDKRAVITRRLPTGLGSQMDVPLCAPCAVAQGVAELPKLPAVPGSRRDSASRSAPRVRRLSVVGEQVPEIRGWLGQKLPPGTDQVEFLPLRGPHAPVTKLQDAGARNGGEHRWMGRDDRLGAGSGQIVKQRSKPKAGGERQRGVGFVHEVEARRQVGRRLRVAAQRHRVTRLAPGAVQGGALVMPNGARCPKYA
jgi:hypothetical protein